MDLFDTLLRIAIRLVAAAMILLAGRKFASFSRSRLRPVLVHAKVANSLVALATSATYYGIWLLAMMAALVVLGVPFDMVLLVAAAVLVVLGIALQESLRDLAATVNFTLFKHFEQGDVIETNGVLGTVQEIELLNTTILRADGKVAVLPNGMIQQNGLLNYSKTGALRADMVFGVSYSDDLHKVKRVIGQVLAEDGRILQDPKPLIIVLELADSSVNIGVRPYVLPKDYWQVQWDLTAAIKLRFDQEGITIPFPQRDVHVSPPL